MGGVEWGGVGEDSTGEGKLGGVRGSGLEEWPRRQWVVDKDGSEAVALPPESRGRQRDVGR